MSRHKAIGILGGTFDPIHFGHLRAALEIQEQFELDEMRLITCHIPPHRTTPKASANDRFSMVQLAVENTPLLIDTRELLRTGPSYTVDTLLSLRSEFPKASLCLAIGGDAFLGLPTWYEWQKILQLSNIVIMHRSGWTMPSSGILNELWVTHLLQENENIGDFTCGKIIDHKISTLDISATHIRSIFQSGLSADFLLPHTVIDYIQKHQLYDFSGNRFLHQPTEAK